MNFVKFFKLDSEEMGIKESGGIVAFVIGLAFIFVLHWVNTPSLPYSQLQIWGNYALIFMAAFTVVLITKPFSKTNPVLRWVVDAPLIAINILLFGYVLITSDTIPLRLGDPDLLDMVAYPLALLVILECTRRTTGNAFVIVVLAFIAYGHFGHLIPGRFGHSDLDFARVADAVFLGVDGLFGSTTRTMVTIIWYFLIFGAFLSITGAGQSFMDLALAIGGPWQGGPAQTAVISSCLFGTISGSGVANVATTGSFTIPLMKSVGYRPHFAGAVEASASMGGQFMPPVMGSAAFLMSGITGIAYVSICKAAILPALFYYFAIFMCVYLEAGRLGLGGLPKDKCPRLWSKDLWIRASVPLTSILAMLAILALGRTPRTSALGGVIWMLGYTFIISFFYPALKLNLSKILKGLSDGFNSGCGLAAILAAAGMCVGIIYFTGLGATFSDFVLELGKDNLLLAITSIMFAALFLGMGLPTPACYLILAIMAGPALKKLGVPLMHSHLMILYYAVFAGITPPVGIAYMAAAGIAGADQMKTGLTAFFKLAFVGLTLPFLWIYKPENLLEGPMQLIIWAIVSNSIGIWGFALGVIGFWKRPINYLLRALCVAASLIALFGPPLYEAAGTLGIIIISYLAYKRKTKTLVAA